MDIHSDIIRAFTNVLVDSWISRAVCPWNHGFPSRAMRSERSHWMGMPRITNGGPERVGNQTLGEREGRSCKDRIRG